jgi:hypothetical protein
MELTLEQIKEFIEQNKGSNDELATYLQGLFPISLDGVQKFVDENQDAKKWLESERDRHATKAITTFKEKTMPGLIEQEIVKRTSGKDAKDLELDNLKAEIENIKRDKLRESLRNTAFKFANDNKLPTDLIDHFISLQSEDDEKGTKSQESTMNNLNQLKDVWSTHLQTVANEKLKSNGFNPKDTGDNPQTLTKEQLLTMSSDEIAKLDQNLVNEALKNG